MIHYIFKTFIILLFSVTLFSHEIKDARLELEILDKNKFIPKIVLTEEEKKFLKINPIIKIGGGESFEPFIFKDFQGKSSGYDREIANIIEEKTGLKIEFDIGPWKQIQVKANKGEIDGLSSVSITDKRKKKFNFTNSYIEYTSIAIVNMANPKKIYKQSDIINKKVAVQKGNILFERLIKSLGNVDIVYYDSIHDVLNAVASNEVDFTVLDESIFYLAEKLGLSNFIKTSFVLGNVNYLYFALNKNNPIAFSIFNKGLNSISEFQKKDLKRKWFRTIDSKINLSKEEKDYLFKKKKINICIDSNWYPFEKNENGKHIGISSDILKLFEKEVGTSFNLVETKSWSQTLKFIQNKSCDILPLAMKTKKREEYLNFTKPYLEVPLVIATKDQVRFIENLLDIKNEKIGMIENHAFIEILKNKYPNLEIISVKDTKSGLEDVENGKLFGYIDALASISTQFQKSFSKDLKISGRFDENWQLSVAVRDDDKILFDIFEKFIATINIDTKQKILNKYISIKYENAIDYSLIYKIIAVSLFIILFILFWTIKIKKDKEKIDSLYLELIKKELKLEEVNRKLKILSTTDKLTNIYNRRKIEELLLDEIERSNRTSEIFSIIMIDIDYFKSINDTYGHQIGDDILCSLSKLIKTNIRKIDKFGRWGGEEFLIISPNSKNRIIEIKADRLRKKIEEYTFKDVGKKTISLGVTEYKKGDNINSILKRADDALYEAKNTGRNKVVFF